MAFVADLGWPLSGSRQLLKVLLLGAAACFLTITAFPNGAKANVTSLKAADNLTLTQDGFPEVDNMYRQTLLSCHCSESGPKFDSLGQNQTLVMVSFKSTSPVSVRIYEGPTIYRDLDQCQPNVPINQTLCVRVLAFGWQSFILPHWVEVLRIGGENMTLESICEVAYQDLYPIPCISGCTNSSGHVNQQAATIVPVVLCALLAFLLFCALIITCLVCKARVSKLKRSILHSKHEEPESRSGLVQGVRSGSVQSVRSGSEQGMTNPLGGTRPLGPENVLPDMSRAGKSKGQLNGDDTREEVKPLQSNEVGQETDQEAQNLEQGNSQPQDGQADLKQDTNTEVSMQFVFPERY